VRHSITVQGGNVSGDVQSIHRYVPHELGELVVWYVQLCCRSSSVRRPWCGRLPRTAEWRLASASDLRSSTAFKVYEGEEYEELKDEKVGMSIADEQVGDVLHVVGAEEGAVRERGGRGEGRSTVAETRRERRSRQ
jgi:hypothetical protein